MNLPAHIPPKGAIRHLVDLLGIDPSAVSAWIRGDLYNNKPLTVENFLKIVQHFWGKPNGLHSRDDVLEFARAAGEDYIFALQRKSFLDALANQSRPAAHEQKTKQSHPVPAFEVSRTGLIRKVHQMARRCQALGSPLVFLGPAGIGMKAKCSPKQTEKSQPAVCNRWMTWKPPIGSKPTRISKVMWSISPKLVTRNTSCI